MKTYEGTCNKNSVSVILNDGTTKAYVNSTAGRAELQGEADADILAQVLQVWGDAPTVTAPEITQPTQEDTIKTELAALDTYIPRGLEDYWAASEFDVTTLPQVQQDRLKKKQDLRGQLQALAETSTQY